MKKSLRPTAPMRPGTKPPTIHHTLEPEIPKMTTLTKKQKIKQAQAAARAQLSAVNPQVSPVGSLVLYDPVSGWTKDAASVRDAFQRTGLDPDVLLPVPPDYGTAFSRSILAIRGQIQGRGYTLLAAGNGPNGESRYSVVAVQRNGVVETEDRATVQCPRDGTAPFVERTTGDATADEIAAWIVKASHERFETYTSDDVRQAIVRTLDHYAAVPVRNAQPFVTYWVAQAGAMALAHLSNTLESLGWGEIQAFEGRMSQANIQFAAKAVNATLEARLTEFAEEADKFAASESSRPGHTARAIERRIQEAKDIKAKAELYRTILGAAVQSVEDRIKAVETSLMSSLDLLDTDDSAAAE